MPEKLELEIGQQFSPFATINELPSSVDSGITNGYPLVKMPINLLGASGYISLLAEPNPEDFTRNKTTPLGRVDLVKVIEGDNMHFARVPLRLEMEFDVKTMEDWHRLQALSAEFNLNDANYYLRCGGCEPEGVARRSIAKEAEVGVFDAGCKDENGNEFDVLLPYDLDKLRLIQAIIVEKEFPL
jgi:hypothetical protein